MVTMGLAPIPGLKNLYIPEYYPDYNDPNSQVKGYHEKLYVNDILLSTAMIFRLVLLVRFLLTFTRFRSVRQQRLCLYSNDQEADFMFAIKSVKEEYPYFFVGFSLIVPLFVLAYCTRVFERPMMDVSD
jgi:hypothetical protein